MPRRFGRPTEERLRPIKVSVAAAKTITQELLRSLRPKILPTSLRVFQTASAVGGRGGSQERIKTANESVIDTEYLDVEK